MRRYINIFYAATECERTILRSPRVVRRDSKITRTSSMPDVSLLMCRPFPVAANYYPHYRCIVGETRQTCLHHVRYRDESIYQRALFLRVSRVNRSESSLALSATFGESTDRSQKQIKIFQVLTSMLLTCGNLENRVLRRNSRDNRDIVYLDYLFLSAKKKLSLKLQQIIRTLHMAVVK